MVKLYDETETEFLNNGIKTLHPYKCDVYKEDNGDYYCEIEDSTDNIEFYQNGRILLVDTKWGSQPFEIQDITPKNNKIVGKFWHLYYRSDNYAIAETYISNSNVTSAMEQLNNNTDNISPFTMFSDIDDTVSYKCIRNSLNEGITELVNRSNGHLVRDKFNIKILASIGEDRNVTLSYRKNIKEIEKQVYIKDWLCTKVLPVGKDGQLLDEIYVSSATQYTLPYTKIVSFEQDIEETDYSTNEAYIAALKSDLQTQAETYLVEHSIPKVNFTVKAEIQNITDIGDTIYVKYEPLNIDLTTQVIAIKYDAILGKYKEIQFGNFKNRLSNLVKDINTKIETVDKKVDPSSTLEKAKQTASDLIDNAEGGSATKTQSEFMILDTGEPATAQLVSRWNIDGLGYSNTGVNGIYDVAITRDGQIVADHITTGVLDGALIKAGSIKAESIATEVLQQGGSNLLYNCVKQFGNKGYTGNFLNTTNTDIQNNSLSKSALFFMNGTDSTTKQVQNGIHNYSLKYKKLIPLANCTVTVNGEIIALDGDGWQEKEITFEVKSNTIEIVYASDTDYSLWAVDILLIPSPIKQKWSANPNEIYEDGIAIGGGQARFYSNSSDVELAIDNDNIGFIKKSTGEMKTTFNDKGTVTDELTANKATIAGEQIQAHTINGVVHVFHS